jgi:hypothetical protein
VNAPRIFKETNVPLFAKIRDAYGQRTTSDLIHILFFHFFSHSQLNLEEFSLEEGDGSINAPR